MLGNDILTRNNFNCPKDIFTNIIRCDLLILSYQTLLVTSILLSELKKI